MLAIRLERVQILNLSPKAFPQLMADLPSVRCRVEYFLELAEGQLPNGSPNGSPQFLSDRTDHRLTRIVV